MAITKGRRSCLGSSAIFASPVWPKRQLVSMQAESTAPGRHVAEEDIEFVECLRCGETLPLLGAQCDCLVGSEVRDMRWGRSSTRQTAVHDRVSPYDSGESNGPERLWKRALRGLGEKARVNGPN